MIFRFEIALFSFLSKGFSKSQSKAKKKKKFRRTSGYLDFFVKKKFLLFPAFSFFIESDDV